MKRLCFLAVLMVLSSSAYAGGSISFRIGGHRVHIESSRYCRSASCASVSISRNLDLRRNRDRFDDDRTAAVPVKPAQQVVSPLPAQAATPPVRANVAPPPTIYTPAAATTQIVAPPPPPPPPVPQVASPLPPSPPPPPPAVKPVEPARPAAPVARVSHEVEEELADSPVGDWQTEGKGTVRIVKCGSALCGYAVDSSSDDKGEAILVNMKPKTDKQWTGSVYSQASGDTYYGTMAMKGINTLRVEACAFGRFYCSGNNWSRITNRADNLVTSRQVSAQPRS